MPHAKTIHSKGAKKVSGQPHGRAEPGKDDPAPIAPILIDKKNFDLEDEILPAPVDKLEETDPLETSESEEDSEEEAALDEEELNPFGDKWEV